MISRNLYLNLAARAILMFVFSLGIGWLIANKGSVILIAILLIIEVIILLNLISYLNSTNRKFSYFLDSVRNDDNTLTFSTQISDQPIRELHQGFNHVNHQIQQLKIEIQQQEQYYQSLLEHVATGIMTFDSQGFILHANTALKKMLSVEVLTHISQMERINRNLFQAIRTIKPFEQKLVSVTTKRGIIQLSIKASSFKIKDNELIMLSLQDIKNELDEKELDSWMKLIRVLMHEIMNSIAPITSLSESLCKFYLVEGRPIQPDELTESTIQTTLRGLNVIREQGNGMMQFVESYRKLTRLPKPELKTFRVSDLMERMKILFASLENNSRSRLVVQITPDDIELEADENLISQVLLNLLKNALEAAQNQEGVIWLTSGRNSNQHIEIRVTDNGKGISDEIMEQIFVPFFTTRENGSGIGLSVSRQIMRLHGGTLQARSIPGKETVFTMVFV